jgi:hypothetical protein
MWLLHASYLVASAAAVESSNGRQAVERRKNSTSITTRRGKTPAISQTMQYNPNV